MAFPFPLFSPSLLKVLFDLEGGGEKHGQMASQPEICHLSAVYWT
jgi:hypothetical protein